MHPASKIIENGKDFYWYNPAAHIYSEIKVTHFKGGTGPFASRELAIRDESRTMARIKASGVTTPKCQHCGK